MPQCVLIQGSHRNWAETEMGGQELIMLAGRATWGRGKVRLGCCWAVRLISTCSIGARATPPRSFPAEDIRKIVAVSKELGID